MYEYIYILISAIHVYCSVYFLCLTFLIVYCSTALSPYKSCLNTNLKSEDTKILFVGSRVFIDCGKEIMIHMFVSSINTIDVSV